MLNSFFYILLYVYRKLDNFIYKVYNKLNLIYIYIERERERERASD